MTVFMTWPRVRRRGWRAGGQKDMLWSMYAGVCEDGVVAWVCACTIWVEFNGMKFGLTCAWETFNGWTYAFHALGSPGIYTVNADPGRLYCMHQVKGL